MSFLNKVRFNNNTIVFRGLDLWQPARNIAQPEEAKRSTDKADEETIPGSLETGSEETGSKELDELIEIFGYDYDPQQDIFISRISPWQRYIGYCRLYDELAAPTGMIIDCEPIHFEYRGKKWMLSFWKGQYDMVTGGEIGFYKSALKHYIPGISSGIFYNAVDDEDFLDMSYVLKKNGETLFTRQAKHWWLTGFRLGEFSEPYELTMEVSVTLKDVFMRNAFLAGMRNAGYTNEELIIDGNTVSFTFDVPRTPQPLTRAKYSDMLFQRKNKFLCDKYKEITGPHGTVQEKIKAIEEQSPEILKRMKKMGKKFKNAEGWVSTFIIALMILYMIGRNLDNELELQP